MLKKDKFSDFKSVLASKKMTTLFSIYSFRQLKLEFDFKNNTTDIWKKKTKCHL